MSPAEQFHVAEAALADVATRAKDPALRSEAVELLIGVSRLAGRVAAESGDEDETPRRRSA